MPRDRQVERDFLRRRRGPGWAEFHPRRAAPGNARAAKSINRSFRADGGAWAALPFMSEPEEAAVAEVFGTLPVLVAVILTRSEVDLQFLGDDLGYLDEQPRPISVPPWLRWMLPSL